MKAETLEKTYNQEVTDMRRIILSFNFPVFRFKCVQTTITQKDLINMLRQLKDTNLKNQLKQFIEDIDSWTEYDTDVDNQTLTRKNLMYEAERKVNKYDEEIRR
jgi:hypothetical protein